MSRAEKFTSLGGNCQKKVQVGHLQTISGTQAIAEYGPPTKILAAVNSNTDLSSILFRLLPIELFEDIARESKRHAYKDWVKEIKINDRDGSVMKKKRLIPSRRYEAGSRHRSLKGDSSPVTTGFVIAWVEIFIYHGATHAGQKCIIKHVGMVLSVRLSNNAMTKNMFDFLRRIIHFENNKESKPRTSKSYDPLWKIRTFIGKITSSLSEAWTTGDALTMDESMTKYRSRALCFLSRQVVHWIKYVLLLRLFLIPNTASLYQPRGTSFRPPLDSFKKGTS